MKQVTKKQWQRVTGSNPDLTGKDAKKVLTNDNELIYLLSVNLIKLLKRNIKEA